MLETERVLRAINRFQDCGGGGDEFTAALGGLSDVFEADCATLEITDRRSGELELMAEARVDPASLAEYCGHYRAISPRVAYGMNRQAKPVVHDADLLTAAELERDPFYAEFLTKYGLRYFLSIAIDPNPDIFAVIAFQFSPRHGMVSKAKLRLAAAARPLLQRGMHTYWLASTHHSPDRIVHDLRSRFGLTAAEAALALSIAAGMPIAQHAERAGVSRNTAYTHYARLKDKLGCRRQAELVALLHRFYPMVDHSCEALVHQNW